MADSTGVIHRDVLADIGYEVREPHASTYGKCIEITAEFIQSLPDGVSAQAVRSYATLPDKDGTAEDLHYLSAIPVSEVRGVASCGDDGAYVFVDLSLDQFSDQIRREGRVSVSYGPKESIPEVLILPPDDTRRERYSDIQVIDAEHVLHTL